MAKVSTAQPAKGASRGSGRQDPTVARGIALVAGLALVVAMVVATGRVRSLQTPSDGAVGSASAGPSHVAVKEQVADAYGKLPLSFIPNAGQADPQVRFAAQGPGFAVSFTPSEALLSFVKGERGHTLALRFLEASPQALTAHQQLPGTVNYLIGDRAQWRTGLPTYEQVVYRDLWPGVDAVFRGGEGKLKYEFHLAPGAQVGHVRLGYSGADPLALGPQGELLIHTPLGTLRDASPLSYQPIGGRHAAVQSRYVLGADGTYGFALGPGYDPRRPVVIDPELAYSTFLGGAGFDLGHDIAVDPAGHAYVAGGTSSLDFPTTPGAFDTSFNGVNDVFVTKLSRDGSALVYSTFIGGSDFDFGDGMGVDTAGHAYVIGRTYSPDFPTTSGAFDTTLDGGNDAFVTKLRPDGSAPVYSTFLGGASDEEGRAIRADSAGHAYATGGTRSPDFPTTRGAFDTTFNGSMDGFVTKLTPDGSALVFSTFLGGTDFDAGIGIALYIGFTPTGYVYITGNTWSPDFPTTPGAFDRSHNGPTYDVIVTKLSQDGSALAYSTFVGGTSSGGQSGRAISVDRAGHAHVTGYTGSADFPTTPGAFDTSHSGGDDAFATKLTPDGSALVYSTFLGGVGFDDGFGIAVLDGAQSSDHAHVTGFTRSTDFPTTPGAFDPTHNGFADVFVTKLSADGSALVYSTFLGGVSDDVGRGIAVLTAVHSATHVYITGSTESLGFPSTPGAFDSTHNGNEDGFVSKFVIGNRAP